MPKLGCALMVLGILLGLIVAWMTLPWWGASLVLAVILFFFGGLVWSEILEDEEEQTDKEDERYPEYTPEQCWHVYVGAHTRIAPVMTPTNAAKAGVEAVRRLFIEGKAVQ